MWVLWLGQETLGVSLCGSRAYTPGWTGQASAPTHAAAWSPVEADHLTLSYISVGASQMEGLTFPTSQTSEDG